MSEGQKVEPAVPYIHLMKRQELKQRILEAVTKAQEKSPPGTGALIVESQRRIFVKSFDAIENCQQREIFHAIETAFQLGKYAAMVDIVTEKKIEAWLDEDKIVDLRTKDRRIGVRFGEIEFSEPLGLATYQTRAAYRNIKIRKIDGAAK